MCANVVFYLGHFKFEMWDIGYRICASLGGDDQVMF